MDLIGKYMMLFSGESMKVGSLYKKSLLTRGVEKANQVMKRQKAQAEIEKALQKQAANNI